MNARRAIIVTAALLVLGTIPARAQWQAGDTVLGPSQPRDDRKAQVVVHLGPLRRSGASGHRFVHYGFYLSLSLLAAILVLIIRDKLQRNRTLDALFWTKKLIPLLHLPPEEVTGKLTELSRKTVLHPVHGEKAFPAIVLQRKLDMVKRINLDRLIDRKDKYIKKYMEVL